MRFRLTVYFLCLFIFLAGCTSSSLPTPQSFGIIYTNASTPDSAYVQFDKNGDIQNQVDIPAMGIFQIESDQSGNLFFPVQYENLIYSLSLAKNELQKTKSLLYPIHLNQKGNFRVTTYNTSLQSGSVEWHQGNKVKKITVSGFPRVATFDQSHVYVFATIIEQKRPVLYWIDRESGKIDATIPVHIDQANDMQIIDDHLYITSVTNQKQIASIHRRTKKITYLTLPETKPEYIFSTSNYLFITHQNNRKLTKLERKTNRILEQIELPQPVFKLQLKADELYVLSQIPANGQGLVGVYNLSDWKLKRKYLLPTIRDTTVQDIVVF
jgi:hypothetical protein